ACCPSFPSPPSNMSNSSASLMRLLPSRCSRTTFRYGDHGMACTAGLRIRHHYCRSGVVGISWPPHTGPGSVSALRGVVSRGEPGPTVELRLFGTDQPALRALGILIAEERCILSRVDVVIHAVDVGQIRQGVQGAGDLAVPGLRLVGRDARLLQPLEPGG